MQKLDFSGTWDTFIICDIEPILGLNFEKIDLEVKKVDFGQKKLPIIYFLISLKIFMDLRSFANASTHFILA